MPGSELYDICKEKGYINGNELSYVDVKSATILIPKTSAEYVMEPDELENLVEQKTREFNDWSKKQFPERYKRKFELYLSMHPDEGERIKGRVT